MEPRVGVLEVQREMGSFSNETLRVNNVRYRESGGVSSEARTLGLIAAFKHVLTDEVFVGPGIHLLSAIPQKYWIAWNEQGPVAVDRHIVDGFVDADGAFYTREQAAQLHAAGRPQPQPVLC